MMPRDEFEAALTQARKFGGFGLDPFFESFLAHDQAQRAVIEQQAKEIESHKKGCFRSHPHDEMNEVCELKTEIARLKNELSHWSWVRFKQLEEENKTLREALQLLYDCQNGCPLPKYEADWNRAMQLSERALKEVS